MAITKILTFLLLAFFYIGCGDSSADTTNGNPEMNGDDLGNVDGLAEFNDSGITAFSENVAEIECINSSNGDALVFSRREGPLPCNHPNGIGNTCSCEFLVGNEVIGYSTRESSNWCQTLENSVLSGRSINFQNGRSYNDHLGMDCSLSSINL